jgi:formylglycine-generating enzyme required for sulfatase activity
VDLFEDDGYERLVRALRVQADKIYVTLKTRRKRSQPEKENLLAGPTKKEILEDEPSKPKVKKTKALRKPNTAIIVALIGFVGTILAALLGSPALVAWMQPTRIPTETPIASRTLVSIPIAAFTGSSPSATLPPDLTPTDTLTPTVTSMPTEITDVKGVSMMLVSSGEFTMGNNASIDARPAHTLYFDAYYMDKYEVTNVLYATCVNVNACKRPKDIHYYDDPDYAEHPVVFVDGYMAKDYCAWRGARLPTEAEWEKAARGPEGKKYPWGETIDCSYANYRGENAHCVGKSTPVGSYESGKSAYGIYDLAGNVTEWVSSLYAPYPYMSNDGEKSNSNGDRVCQARNSTDPFVLSTDRTWTTPSQAEFDQGFRCARDVDS